MSDHTSDGFPTERYEGPMATERRTPAVEVAASVMSDVMSMSPDEFAEHARVNTPAVEVVTTCRRCSGKGWYMVGDSEGTTGCDLCFGTGTNPQLLPIDSQPTPTAMWEVDGVPVPVYRPDDSGATVNATGEFPAETRGDYATAPVYKCNSKECGGLSLESGLFEGLCACGASVTEVRDVSKDQYRRMCAQADEIGALKGRLAETAGALDTYRARCAELLRERDEARAEVERLKKTITMHEATQMLAQVGYDSGQRRIAALEAVIDALRESAVRMDDAHVAIYRSLILMANAGLELPAVADDVVVKE